MRCRLGGAILAALVLAAPAGCALQASGPGLVAVLTDYGTTDFYVGVLEGAMYTAAPGVRISTITHEVEPFNIAEGSYLLAQTAAEYPAGTVFVAVVDPGVGTERRSIVVETADGKLFVAPDNGLLTGVIRRAGMGRAWEITNRDLMRRGGASSTFHGRDIYGPVAAHLAAGADPETVGLRIADPLLLKMPAAHAEGARLVGAVVHVDRYGNLITNIPGGLLAEAGIEKGARLNADLGTHTVTAVFATTYGDVPEGAWVALLNAEGDLEIARNMAHAAQTVAAAAGTGVVVTPGWGR